MRQLNQQWPSDRRRRVYEILEHGSAGDRASLLFDRGIVVLIIINLSAVTLESMPPLAIRYRPWFNLIEYGSLVAFTLEYVLRLWAAVEHAPYRHLPARAARFKYILSGSGIVDLCAVLPFWFAFLLPADLRVVLVLRMIRFLKITRYSPAMRSLLDVLYSERRALFGCLVILLGSTLIAAAAMHIVEGRVQPDKLGTIPDALWWAITTLSTVGYGDIVPVTPLGRLIAAATMVIGLIMVALPVGIVANAFSEENHRRDFVITWGMVARVPLFSGLTANEIADIMRLLRARQVEAGAMIVRRGEPGHSMYFIAAGEVEIELPHDRRRLGAGHFFGEVAILRRARRSGQRDGADPHKPAGPRRTGPAHAHEARSAHYRAHSRGRSQPHQTRTGDPERRPPHRGDRGRATAGGGLAVSYAGRTPGATLGRP
ncbi:MAG TPA: cyclic nucleotide-gated ion channel [Xanthobacteraceae bacterium]|jgi:voltage-gated potassium channel